MRRLILASGLTSMLLSGCGRPSAEPAAALPPPKVPSSVSVVVPGLTIRCCRLGEQNAAIVIGKGEFPDPIPMFGGQRDGFWIQFSPEVALRWRCHVLDDLTGTIEFEPQPGEFWPHDAFGGRLQKFDLTEGGVFVVSRANSPQPPNAVKVPRPERVQVGVPVDSEVAELSRIDVTQLVRPWRDLTVEQLTDAIAGDEAIRSLTTDGGESREQIDDQPPSDASNPANSR